MASYLDSAQIEAMAMAMGTWESTTSSQEWASASREFVDIEWGALSLLWDPTLPASAPLVQAELTMADEALEGYLPPEIKGVADLQAEFPIQLEEDSGGIGLKRYHVHWVDGKRYMEDGEPYDCVKESQSTCNDHHAHFYEWTLFRLQKTLAHYKNLFVINETMKGVLTFSLRERLMPLQLLMRGPFVWDQEGAVLGVRAHGKKMDFVSKGARGAALDTFTREIAGRMMARLRESEDCEVLETPAGSRHLFQVLLHIDEETVAAATITKPVAPIAATAPIARPVAPIAATAPIAKPVAPIAAPVAKPAGPSAVSILKSGEFPVVWKRYSDAECRVKDDRGYYHAIEVKNAFAKRARDIDNDLFAALKPCDDCKLLPPPAGSPYLFVVQVLAPRR